MKKWLILLGGLTIALVVASACTSEAPTPIRSPSPTPTPTSGATTAAPLTAAPLTETDVRALLTVRDVERVLTTAVPLITRLYDYKKQLASVDPERGAGIDMDSFFGLSFQTQDGMKAITLTVSDFAYAALEKDPFDKLKSAVPQLEVMDPPVGDASARVEVNAGGIGSTIMFAKGDKSVQLHTAQPNGESPLTSLEGLEQLARIVEKRL